MLAEIHCNLIMSEIETAVSKLKLPWHFSNVGNKSSNLHDELGCFDRCPINVCVRPSSFTPRETTY